MPEELGAGWDVSDPDWFAGWVTGASSERLAAEVQLVFAGLPVEIQRSRLEALLKLLDSRRSGLREAWLGAGAAAGKPRGWRVAQNAVDDLIGEVHQRLRALDRFS